jgi:outer membrane receptor protein involved in Fe transport
MKILGVSFIAAVAALATAGPARADDAEELRGLLDQPVLSGASRKTEVASAAPATSSTITAEQLRRYGIRTLDEALNYLSLGMTASDRLHGVEVGARGVLVNGDYGNHVLLLVNGHAVNEQWTGGALFERGAGIPMELVDHIEVILGPGSVLYGSGAMLGVINVVTKRAKDYRGVHVIAESELPISARAAVGAGTDFEYQGDRGEVTVQVEYYAQRGPTFDFGPQRDALTYKQLGNGVNVGAASYVYRTHVQQDAELIAERAPGIVEAVERTPDNPDESLGERREIAAA